LFLTNSGDTSYLRYTERYYFSDGAVIVGLHYRVNDYYYVIDSSGNILYKSPSPFLGIYGNGLAPVESPDNYKYGYIDKYGVVKIDFRFAGFK